MDVALSFLDAGGVERRERFDAATEVLYEEAQTFPSFKGQRNHPGARWSATSGRHVGFESWLERGMAILLDFDHDVTAFSCRPF